MFSFSYWFNAPYNGTEGIEVYIVTTICIFLLALVSRFLYHKNKHNTVLRKYVRPFPKVLFTFGIIFALFTFLRYQRLYLFSSRIWFVIILIALLWWLLPKLIKFFKNYVHEVEEVQREKEKYRYYPKHKKK